MDVDPESRLGKILASGKITMGTAPDFAPMEFKNVGAKGVEYVGSDIELGKYIAEKLGVELEIKAMEFSAIQQGLASGTIDMGISGFAYTEERAETLGLSDRYNIQSEDKGHTLLVLKEDAASYKTAEDFSGKKVVAQNASPAAVPGDRTASVGYPVPASYSYHRRRSDADHREGRRSGSLLR